MIPVLLLLAMFAAAALWPEQAPPAAAYQRRPPGWYLAQARARADAAAGRPVQPAAPTPPGAPMGRTVHPRAAATWGDIVRAPERRRPRPTAARMEPTTWPAPPRPRLRPRMPITKEFIAPVLGVPPRP